MARLLNEDMADMHITYGAEALIGSIKSIFPTQEISWVEPVHWFN